MSRRLTLSCVLLLSSVQLALPAAAQTAAPPEQSEAPSLAGVHSGVFFIRDRGDALRLYVQGRAMVDFYSFLGPGVTDVKALNPTFLLRKVRMEAGGELFQRVQWFFGGDFGMNSTGLGANQSVVMRAAPADVFVNFMVSPLLNVQVGQFDLPFTAETRTADKLLPFMERSVPVRVIGKGNIKDSGVMAWGILDQRLLSYAIALVQGDGMNRANVDHRFDGVARVFVRPLARGTSELRNLQFGASVRYGWRQNQRVAYDYPAMTTEGGYVFWRPTYGSPPSTANPQGTTHVIPTGSQLLAAAELRVPSDTFDLTVEGLYGREDTREAQDADLYGTLRRGTLESFGYYAQVGWWPAGNAYVNGIPGDQGPTRLDLGKKDVPPASAVQLLIRWEQLHSEYLGSSRGGTTPSGIEGNIRVNTLSLGANYWVGRNLRVSANYGLSHFPDSAPSSEWTSEQRAQAPGNTLAPGVNDSARSRANTLHELLARVQVAF